MAGDVGAGNEAYVTSFVGCFIREKRQFSSGKKGDHLATTMFGSYRINFTRSLLRLHKSLHRTASANGCAGITH